MVVVVANSKKFEDVILVGNDGNVVCWAEDYRENDDDDDDDDGVDVAPAA
ncbi:hypothetical protein BVC80_407g9 [Macleaya cordata]|uniref:Uncharacterized protein n=1 Tax=Macleaya cordata TaxID=56857 RepID=A0A200R067_MACCD|nr:hypothetical protein BVC80_407g9 [Macleaya cordata]